VIQDNKDRNKTFYGYVRASTVDQEVTLLAQRRAIQECYDSRYAPEGYAFGGIFEDAAVSASLELHRREHGGRLWALLSQGDVIVVHRHDRTFRDLEDFARNLKLWAAVGVSVRVLNLMGLDTDTPTGRFVLSILTAFGQFEREQTGERVGVVMAERKLRGLPGPGRYPPYGFTRVGPPGKRRYRPCPEQRAVGRKIVEWLRAGWSLDQVHRHLLAQGVRNPNTDAAIGRASVWRWYVGEVQLQEAEERQTLGRSLRSLERGE
jgi:DNA invertase Pin-like site-specific DNA recombinase